MRHCSVPFFCLKGASVMDIEGKLIQKLGVQSGKSARGDWAKQEFVIEYQEGNFPTKACFSVWGADRVKELENFREGDHIKVSFNVSSREYNGRWYTDLRAWRINTADAQAAGGQGSSYRQPQPDHGQQYQDMPAGFAPAAAQPSAAYTSQGDRPQDGDDDLPF